MKYYYFVTFTILFRLIDGFHTNSLLNHGFNYENSWHNETKISYYIPEKHKVNLKVYYETLCPASVSFFTSQLKPVVEKLASYVDVDLVPYGHAKTHKVRGRYSFTCQHGPDECLGNKMHACAVDAFQNKTKAALFNACLMQYSSSYYDDATVLNWCGFKMNLLINGVWECINSERGSVLLKEYGEVTNALRPRYVPYVSLDGSTDNQEALTVNLMSTICDLLQPRPSAC